ncbi:hypothetical protein HOY80DRAFT_650158 [Tuber brumale]|nr:hypothetical protein HOY80DRAFT_650158 [Tuber brumale]
MSRSANVFPGSRKLAVVIDNRSRSRSASTNGYQEGWNRTSPAIKDPRDDATTIPHSKLRRAVNSPTPQEFSQSSADQRSFLECANGSSALRRRRLKRPPSVSEVPDSEEERERDLTGGPMALEPLEGYRDGCNSRQPTNGYRPLPSTSPGQQPQDRTAGGSWHEISQRQFNGNEPSDAHSNGGPPLFRPSSSPHRGKEVVERTTSERTSVSSPHYSPPPPDTGANDSLSHRHNETDRLAPRSQVVWARSSSVDSVVSCRRCGSGIAILDNRRVDICPSCIRREHCRGSDLADRKSDLRSRHSSTLSATGLPDNRSNTTPTSDSLLSDISGGCTPQERPPVEVFRTAKQRVIEKYQMKFPDITNGSLPSQPIKETAIKAQKARKIMDLPKPKVATAAERLKTAAPLKKNGANAATLVQASARVDARKPINGSSLSDILSATEPPKRDTRIGAVKSIAQLKKPARKGPAIKYAGGSISRVLITDDSTGESDHSGKLRAVEKRLQDQRSYTKNQAEKAAKLQVKLQESEREKAALQEKLKALLAIGNHGPNEKPAPGNGDPEPGATTEPLPAQGSLQQAPPKKKVLKRLVRWEETHSDQSTPQEDTQTDPGAGDSKPDTTKRTFRYGSMRDFYSGSKFCGEDPWAYPTIAEQPEPDPSTFRKRGWRKSVYRPFDRNRLMKVHLHRLASHNRPPLTVTVESPPDGDDESASVPNTPIGNKTGKPENEHGSTGVPRVISFDEFMGLPENMVPTVKDGCLGFRSGAINPRTGRLERNVPHHRIRAPGDLKLT